MEHALDQLKNWFDYFASRLLFTMQWIGCCKGCNRFRFHFQWIVSLISQSSVRVRRISSWSCRSTGATSATFGDGSRCNSDARYRFDSTVFFLSYFGCLSLSEFFFLYRCSRCWRSQNCSTVRNASTGKTVPPRANRRFKTLRNSANSSNRSTSPCENGLVSTSSPTVKKTTVVAFFYFVS